MRFASFTRNGRASYGLVREDGVVDLGRVLEASHATLTHFIADFAALAQRADLFDRPADAALEEITLAIPLPDASRIVCVGLNYHAERLEPEQRDPGAPPNLFFRTARSFAAHGQAILRPPESPKLDYEGELALVVGTAGRRIRAENAMEHVFGFACANEGTIRDWVHHARHNITQGKNWERSGSMGPWIVTRDALSPPRDLAIETRVNGAVRQKGGIDAMIRPFGALIAYISTFMALEPGDIILTGTPPGAGSAMQPQQFLMPGDVLEVEVSGIGVLRNPVADET